MTYYVSDNYGNKMAAGKDFTTLQLAVAAAVTTVKRRNSNKRAHGDTSYSVIEAIPGKHKEVAYVTPEQEVIYK